MFHRGLVVTCTLLAFQINKVADWKQRLSGGQKQRMSWARMFHKVWKHAHMGLFVSVELAEVPPLLKVRHKCVGVCCFSQKPTFAFIDEPSSAVDAAGVDVLFRVRP